MTTMLATVRYHRSRRHSRTLRHRFRPHDPFRYTWPCLQRAYPATNSVTVNVGGVTAQVLAAALVAAGLYQINIVVPSGLTAGNNAIVASVGSYSSQSGVYLNIATS